MTLHNLGTAFIVLVLLFDVYLAWDFYRRYQADKLAHPDEHWTRHAWHAVHDSLTILWTKFCTGVSTFALFLDPVSELIGGDEFKNALHQQIGNPKIWAAVLLGFTAITYYARMRTIWLAMKNRTAT